MDAGTIEREGPPLHGLVNAEAPGRQAARSPARRGAVLLLLPLAAIALLAGLAGGLLRAGVAIQCLLSAVAHALLRA